MRIFLGELLDDSSGATAVEYGLILALVFLAMIGAVTSVGNTIIGHWNYVSDTSTDAVDRAAI